MAFTSPLFLFCYLPCFLVLYWLVGVRFRPLVLLLGSMIFYVWGEGGHVAVLLFVLLLNYSFAHLINTAPQGNVKITCLFAVTALNLSILFSYKYQLDATFMKYCFGNSFEATQSHLPLGLSFFIFQAISYCIDVYQKVSTPTKNPMKLLLYLGMFPKISGGPIVRYREVESASSHPVVHLDDVAYGAKRFIVGLGKKVIIADTLAKTADQLFAIPSHDLTAPTAWLGITCYTLQLYFDFSGYSDMAIGLGRMMGLRFSENFNYPYAANSLTDFWRRWHMSLTSWFRDYLFTPLLYTLMTDSIRQKMAAGTYRTNYRSMVTIIVVFTFCGWWHGPTFNFILWGLFHGIVLAAESWKLGKVIKRLPLVFQHGYTLLLVMLGWVLFRNADFGVAAHYYCTLFGFSSGSPLYSLKSYLTNELIATLVIAVLAMGPTASLVRKFVIDSKMLTNRPWAQHGVESLAIMIVLVLSLFGVASSTYTPFIYFRF